MNPLQKAVRSLIRLLAAGTVIINVMLGGLQLLNHRASGREINSFQITFHAFLFLAGVGLFACSTKLAARLTDESDADADDSEPPADPDK